MRFLAMDTSNSTCCAGVYKAGKELGYRLSMEQRTHSETFMPIVHEVMTEAGISHNSLDFYAITVGPGSFTGIRIGMACVKGMAAASGKPCVPVSSVEALARSVEVCDTPQENTVLISCFEARNNRVFAGAYMASNYMRLVPDNAYNADELISILMQLTNLQSLHFILLGNGCDTMNKAIERSEFTSKVLSVNYAPGAVIMPRGIASAATKMVEYGFSPLCALELEPMYCAKAQAERLNDRHVRAYE